MMSHQRHLVGMRARANADLERDRFEHDRELAEIDFQNRQKLYEDQFERQELSGMREFDRRAQLGRWEAERERISEGLRSGELYFSPHQKKLIHDLDVAEERVRSNPELDERTKLKAIQDIRRKRQNIKPRITPPDMRKASREQDFRENTYTDELGRDWVRGPHGEWSGARNQVSEFEMDMRQREMEIKQQELEQQRQQELWRRIETLMKPDAVGLPGRSYEEARRIAMASMGQQAYSPQGLPSPSQPARNVGGGQRQPRPEQQQTTARARAEQLFEAYQNADTPEQRQEVWNQMPAPLQQEILDYEKLHNYLPRLGE